MNNISCNGFKRVSKKTAIKLYNNGVTIYLLPCKARVNSLWFTPYQLNIENNTENTSIQTIINNFEFYNCNAETGYYTAFYVKE